MIGPADHVALDQAVPLPQVAIDPGLVQAGYSRYSGVSFSPLSSQPGVILRVQTDRPYVALTVDDFYTANYNLQVAPHILQEADQLHATLTLCPAGSALVAYTRRHPDQAAQIKQFFRQGDFELCNHTYNHPVMPRLSEAAQEQQMLMGRSAIENFFGRAPSRIFRPPFGSWNAFTVRAAAAAGYREVVTWSVDTGDSEGPERPASQLLADTSCARQGDIILMHANRLSSAQALPMIINMLRRKGLEPVTLSTLLASGTPIYSNSPPDMKHLKICR